MMIPPANLDPDKKILLTKILILMITAADQDPDPGP